MRRAPGGLAEPAAGGRGELDGHAPGGQLRVEFTLPFAIAFDPQRILAIQFPPLIFGVVFEDQERRVLGHDRVALTETHDLVDNRCSRARAIRFLLQPLHTVERPHPFNGRIRILLRRERQTACLPQL